MKLPTGDQVRSTLVRSQQIRPMETRDIRRVLEIADGLAHAPHWPITAYQAAINPKSEPQRLALVTEELQQNAPNLEALESCEVVGFVVGSLVAGEAELESIAVAAEAQRSGTGGRLLSHLTAALRELSVTRINLEVRASNDPALRLYKRHGFRETGRRVGYYADPVEDAVLMDLDFG
jgi:ribosomal-protein-alanine N-acetyltransferase